MFLLRHESIEEHDRHKKHMSTPAADLTNQSVEHDPQSSRTQPMSVARAAPLLICSIGNPGSLYANTLHSAGHFVVQKVAESLDAPAFQKSRQHGNGLLTRFLGPQDTEWALWQSTAYMNECGKGVRDAFQEWSREVEGGKLVVIHDQLEDAFAAVSTKSNPNASLKGHNGLKSIKAAIGQTPYTRIGIGISRPVSRDPDDVAKYVLRKMVPTEKEKMASSIDRVITSLKAIGKAP